MAIQVHTHGMSLSLEDYIKAQSRAAGRRSTPKYTLQGFILDYLWKHGTATVKDLAKRRDCNPANIQVAIRKMEAQGVVFCHMESTDSPQLQQRKRIHLSKKGWVEAEKRPEAQRLQREARESLTRLLNGKPAKVAS